MPNSPKSFRSQLYIIIFEAETKAGRTFDVVLLWAIVVSVLAVMLESIAAFRLEFGQFLFYAEWFFTAFFTAEYLARIYCSRKRLGYMLSFFGIVDLLAVLPTFLSLVFHGFHALMIIRAIRLLRVFRLFKLSRHISEAQVLMTALAASRAKITVFLGSVLTLVMIIGSVMYLVEGEENGFTSIPQGIYWAIVTMTTVGYGDMAPKTPLGQLLASMIMVVGYGIIAIPTGIVSVELQQASNKEHNNTRYCGHCHIPGHEKNARFCRFCGGSLT